ncbi:uncharacterized protein LOC130663765 [Microplitis mediator]|uniref:uncharacterized protein LOC130663714 n=1 Tax=Microplitis mediator TaxID=375433 RepID=UPI00255347E7|nr:uncharacterized protein LOC130663714 [Microplitis mediator]XP_057319188.1 uncharacterized protein LOC130663765 [Microplitis mediator]
MQNTSKELKGNFFVVEIHSDRKYWHVVSREWMEKNNVLIDGYIFDANLYINIDFIKYTWSRRYNGALGFIPKPKEWTGFETAKEAEQEARSRNFKLILEYKRTDALINESFKYSTLEFQVECLKTELRIRKGLETMLPIRTLTGLVYLNSLLERCNQPTSLDCNILLDTLTDKNNVVESLYKILTAFFTADSKFLCIEIDYYGREKLKNLRILNKIKNHLAPHDKESKIDVLMKRWFFKRNYKNKN